MSDFLGHLINKYLICYTSILFTHTHTHTHVLTTHVLPPVFCSGMLGVILAMAVSQMERSFLRSVLNINGALTGPQIGLFMVALFLPWVTAKVSLWLICFSPSTWIRKDTKVKDVLLTIKKKK